MVDLNFFLLGLPHRVVLDRVYSLKLKFPGLIRKSKKNESFKKVYVANIKISMQKILGFWSICAYFGVISLEII